MRQLIISVYISFENNSEMVEVEDLVPLITILTSSSKACYFSHSFLYFPADFPLQL